MNGEERKQERKADAVVQAKSDVRRGHGRGSKKSMDSGYVLKVAWTRLTDGWNEGSDRRRFR